MFTDINRIAALAKEPRRARGVTPEEPTAGILHGGVREGRELTGPRWTYTRTKLETADRAKEPPNV